MLSIAISGCVARTSLRSVSANASGLWLVRATTKTGGPAVMGVGQINRALPGGFRELRLFHRPDDADDGEEFRFVRFIAVRQTLAERPAVRPVTPREILVHHADTFRAVRILRREEPSFAQRNAERGEIIAVHPVGIMTVQRLARRRHIALRRHGSFAAISGSGECS